MTFFRPISPLTARNPLFFRGQSIDHRKMKNRTRSIFVPIFSGTIRTGTPAITVSGTNTRYRAWAFDAASTEEILFEAFVPTDWERLGTNFTPHLWHTNLGAGSGDCVWQLTLHTVNDTTLSGGINGDLNATAGETAGNQAFAAPIQNALSISDFTITVSPSRLPTARSMIRIGLARLGADAADTLANDAGVVGLELRYTADM